MIDQLQQIIQQITEKEVSGNANVKNELAGNVAQETGSSLMEGLKSAISNGNMTEIMGMMNNTDVNSLTSNPVVKNIIEMLTSKLTKNVGIDASASSGLAGSIIPQLLSMVLGGKGNFNITDLIGSLTGGSSAGGGSILDSLGKMGLDQNGDGKVGIDDAISAVTKGGLGDLLGGFFKK